MVQDDLPEPDKTQAAAPRPRADQAEATVPSLPASEAPTLASGTAPKDTAPSPPPPAPAPAPARRPAEDPLVGRILGGCRLDALIGKGAMGAVYKGWQLSLDRLVAVKIIRPELLEDVRALKRFEIEARTIARFRNPHVITVHDVGTDEGLHFLVMEFVAGRNLRQIARERPHGRLGTAEAIDLLTQACVGLKEAQRLGVLHRDIKPDNLMLDESGVLKIADFGIAKVLHDDLHMTMTSELTGTPLYMSPEQCRSSAVIDFRSDMYSLGAAFFYLLTGEPPVKASSIYQLIDTKTKLECLRLAQFLPEVDERHPLGLVIARMTALLPESRYQSYDDLLADLERVKADKPLAQVAVGPLGKLPAPLPKPPARKQQAGKQQAGKQAAPRSRAAAIASLLLLVAGGAAVAIWRPWQTNAYAQQDGPTDPGRNGPDPAPEPGPVIPLPVPPGPVPDSDPGPTGPTPAEVEAAARAREAAEANARMEAERRADAELGETLERVGRTLREQGPSSEMTQELLREGTDPELLARRNALRRDVDHGIRTRATLSNVRSSLRPTEPSPPFAGVKEYFDRVAETLAPPGESGEELKQWLDRAKQQEPANGDYAGRCVRALASSFAAVRDAATSEQMTRAALDERARSLANLEQGKATLLQVLGDQQDAIEAAAPAAALTSMRSMLEQQRKVTEQRELLGHTLGRARELRTLAEWLRAKDELKRQIEERGRGLEGLEPHPGPSQDLQSLREVIERWEAVERRLAGQLAAFAKGRLGEAAQTGAAPAAEETTVATAARTVAAAFSAFAKDLDDSPLHKALQDAGQALDGLPAELTARAPALQRMRDLEVRLAALVEAAADMERIPGGKARLSGSREADVAAFYCGRTEVSVAQWAEFLAAMRAIAQGGQLPWAEVMEALRTQYGVAPADPMKTMQMVTRTLPENRALPIDEISHREAALFAAFRGHALPTLEEWSLAAFGTVPDHRAFPWGNAWSDEFDARNTSNRYLVEIERGGNSWRNRNGARLHHLAGNVAEWLEAPSDAASAQLAGGHFLEPKAVQERRARGEPATARTDARERGYGLRTVLRPRPFFGPLWPQ